MTRNLFRAKDLHDGEWVEGYYCHLRDPFKNRESHRIYTGYAETNRFEFYPAWYEVDPATVSRYAELEDKNGERIFEGDYVVCKKWLGGNFVDECVERGYVEIKHGAFGLHRKQGYYRPFKDWLEDYEYEVIGNIHDNPELLEGEDQ